MNDSVHLISGQGIPKLKQTYPRPQSPTSDTYLVNPPPLSRVTTTPVVVVTVSIKGYHHYYPFYFYLPTLHPISRQGGPYPPWTSVFLQFGFNFKSWVWVTEIPTLVCHIFTHFLCSEKEVGNQWRKRLDKVLKDIWDCPKITKNILRKPIYMEF